MQSLNEKNIWENMYFQIGIISKLASYFVPTTLFSWSHLEAFGLLCTSNDRLLRRCFSISDFKDKIPLFERSVFEGGRSLLNNVIYTQCPC